MRGQRELFSRAELSTMRDRTRRRNYSAEAEAFRRRHERDRAWGLQRRHAEKLARCREKASETPPPQPAAGPDPATAAGPAPGRPVKGTAPASAATRTASAAPPGSQTTVASGPKRRGPGRFTQGASPASVRRGGEAAHPDGVPTRRKATVAGATRTPAWIVRPPDDAAEHSVDAVLGNFTEAGSKPQSLNYQRRRNPSSRQVRGFIKLPWEHTRPSRGATHVN